MDIEYIKIRNRSIRWLRGMQLAFWPYVFCCLAIFFWMGYNPNHECRTGALYVWIGFGILINFMLLLGVQGINVPPVIHKTEECKPDAGHSGPTGPTSKENYFDNHRVKLSGSWHHGWGWPPKQP